MKGPFHSEMLYIRNKHFGDSGGDVYLWHPILDDYRDTRLRVNYNGDGISTRILQTTNNFKL